MRSLHDPGCDVGSTQFRGRRAGGWRARDRMRMAALSDLSALLLTRPQNFDLLRMPTILNTELNGRGGENSMAVSWLVA